MFRVAILHGIDVGRVDGEKCIGAPQAILGRLGCERKLGQLPMQIAFAVRDRHAVQQSLPIGGKVHQHGIQQLLSIVIAFQCSRRIAQI